MVQDVFDSILQDLGKIIKIEGLQLDQSQTCLIQFPNGLLINIEPYKKDDFMLISTKIGEISPGRYREDVLREALKNNGQPQNKSGIFGFSPRSSQLILFGMVSLREVSGEKIASFLYPFMEKALSWKNTVAAGQIPLADTVRTSRVVPAGIFGLR